MKRRTIIFGVLLTMSTATQAQSKTTHGNSSPQSVTISKEQFASKASKMSELLATSKVEETAELYKAVVSDMLNILNATEKDLIKAQKEKNGNAEVGFAAQLKKQIAIYSHVAEADDDMATLPQYITEFAQAMQTTNK